MTSAACAAGNETKGDQARSDELAPERPALRAGDWLHPAPVRDHEVCASPAWKPTPGRLPLVPVAVRSVRPAMARAG